MRAIVFCIPLLLFAITALAQQPPASKEVHTSAKKSSPPAIDNDHRGSPQVEVTAPYLDMHTGPGRGYPVYHIIEKGEPLAVLKRRTDWYKIETLQGKTGWINRKAMAGTQWPDGTPFLAEALQSEDYVARRWEGGFHSGDFNGASTLGGYLAYRFTPNISTELRFTQALGNFSNSKILALNLVQQPFPEWRISPYFTLGAGKIRTEPDATLVRTQDREDNILSAGMGAYAFITDRLILRLEYTSHVILTSRNNNEEIEEWKAGFSVYF